MFQPTIQFVTSNPGKVTALQNRLGEYAAVQQLQLEVPEIQAATAMEIALYKARYAFAHIGKPLLMQDSAFHIRALGGFPGPYIRYVNETIGPTGLLKLMEDKTDRRCYFKSAVVYIDEQGEEHTFSNDIHDGTIATTRYEQQHAQAWSALWQVYIPHWATQPLAALSKHEIDQFEQAADHHSEMYRFASWYKSTHPTG